MIHKKLVIGTAQFGMNYGIANKKGVPNDKEILKIFNLAISREIKCIDTATAYGNSEQRLGGLLKLNNFDVTTKIKNNFFYSFDTLSNSVKNCCERMRVNHIDTLLLHGLSDSKELNKNNLDLLEKLKSKGIVKRIGISIYSKEEFSEILNNYQLDVMQIPLNILNRNCFSSNLFKKAKSRRIELQIRSVFLQGLLLMKKENRPLYFKKWHKLFEKWDKWIIQEKISSIEACLSFAFKNKNIDKVIIGIDSYSQLSSILKILDNLKEITPPKEIYSLNQQLVDPSKWNL